MYSHNGDSFSYYIILIWDHRYGVYLEFHNCWCGNSIEHQHNEELNVHCSTFWYTVVEFNRCIEGIVSLYIVEEFRGIFLTVTVYFMSFLSSLDSHQLSSGNQLSSIIATSQLSCAKYLSVPLLLAAALSILSSELLSLLVSFTLYKLPVFLRLTTLAPVSGRI